MTIFLGKFSTLQCRNTSSWNPSTSQKFCGIEKLSALKEGIMLFHQNFLSHSTALLCHWDLLCFRKLLEKKKKLVERRADTTSFGQIFFPHSTENFVGGTLVFRKCSDIEIFLVIRNIKILSRAFCMLVLWKLSGNVSIYQRNSSLKKKIVEKRKGITFFRREFFVTECGKTSWITPCVFKEISRMENFLDNRRVSEFSAEIFLSHSTKKSYWKPSAFQKVSSMKKNDA